MQAVAFETKIENDVIRIPREYRGRIPSTATVTILYSYKNSDFAQEENDSWDNMINSMKNAKKVENFKIYSKDEINAR